jgi:hypothetical protein
MIGLILFAGCVPSLNPVYTPKDIVFDARTLGVWKQPGKAARWEFQQRDETSYRLLYTDDEGRQGKFQAHLAKIEGTMFLDLYPEELPAEASGFYQFHLVPIHTVYLVRQTESKLELLAIDLQWLDKHLAAHPDEIACATFNGRRLITAPTADVQKFVLAHQDKFTAKFDLEKVTGTN